MLKTTKRFVGSRASERAEKWADENWPHKSFGWQTVRAAWLAGYKAGNRMLVFKNRGHSWVSEKCVDEYCREVLGYKKKERERK